MLPCLVATCHAAILAVICTGPLHCTVPSVQLANTPAFDPSVLSKCKLREICIIF